MNVLTHILQKEAAAAKTRLEQLERLNAPQVIVDAQRKLVDDLSKGVLEVGGDQSLLALDVDGFELRKGRGGKPYFHYTTPQGVVNYYPVAKHGRFIAVAK